MHLLLECQYLQTKTFWLLKEVHIYFSNDGHLGRAGEYSNTVKK